MDDKKSDVTTYARTIAYGALTLPGTSTIAPPLAPVDVPSGPVHVFDRREGDSRVVAVCGERAERKRVVEDIFVEGHPSACPGCRNLEPARSYTLVVVGRVRT